MRQLGVIYPHEVDPSLPPQDYASYTDRPAGRAIIFDGQRVALIHVSASGYYMLPGGGLDGEDAQTGLIREVLEETGMRIELLSPVGRITVYFDRWHKRQIDDCFTARMVGMGQVAGLTDFETAEGYGLVWASTLQKAITLMENAVPLARDGKLVRARDLLFLRAVAAK